MSGKHLRVAASGGSEGQVPASRRVRSGGGRGAFRITVSWTAPAGLQPAASQQRPGRDLAGPNHYGRARCRFSSALRSPSGILVSGRSVPIPAQTPPAPGPSGVRYGAAVVHKSEAEGGDPEQLLDVAVPSWIENVVRAVSHHRDQQGCLG
ncbi:hypothetical protein T07_993 [Trichinella nelsoni]|uniref:Uncharacterized protein n=1 Tax=Trichinella nelsoni TaxID=6336 RepID=A0A0V0RN44_9BILA|nr:hypothetical protein T07_993 [Trichinella nelsoni]